jgi:hypothetical protein
MKLLSSTSKRMKWISLSIVVCAFLLAVPAFAGHIEKMDINGVTSDVYVPDGPAPRLSADGKTLFNSTPVLLVDDPNPPNPFLRIPPPAELAESASDRPSAATFTITYTPAGSSDPWGAVCQTFPDEAKAAFNAAAAVWGSLLSSSVPISITACWSNLGAVSTLGYSGGGSRHANFTNAPRGNTWYKSSLANSLAGSDLDPATPDMYITYNSNFTWYYGTDGATPVGQHDLMSVVLHEIAHGLNFSGSMTYSGGVGSWGYGTGYPNIYDTFVYDGSGNQLINTGVYGNGSTDLGSALTSNNIWFCGSNAMVANGGPGASVRMYAPASWTSGSSYSHLDYSTFAGGANALMVYAISSGVAIHSPGPVTLGLLKDLGWNNSTPPPPPPPPPVLPNLKPYRPSQWSSKLVVTHYRGDTVNCRLYAGYKIYVDWAVANLSQANISKKFFIRLYIDGALKKTWAVSSLKKGYYKYFIGSYIGGLSRGTHELTIVADNPNRIAETKETDNTFVRRVRVY